MEFMSELSKRAWIHFSSFMIGQKEILFFIKISQFLMKVYVITNNFFIQYFILYDKNFKVLFLTIWSSQKEQIMTKTFFTLLKEKIIL